MDRLIKEQLESLLHEAGSSKRQGRRIINLAGFLSPAEPPAAIREQLDRLSRLLIQQDAFEALLEPINLLARAGLTQALAPQAVEAIEAIEAMIGSLEQARRAIFEQDAINYAELIAWLVSLAQARKLIRPRHLD